MENKNMVYILKCIKTNKYYIGQTSKRKYSQRSGKNGKRYLGKDKTGRYTQPKIANAILKYGWDSFILVGTTPNLSDDDANILERYLIEKYNSLGDGGYNIQSGGKYKIEYTPDTIKRISSNSRETYNYSAHYKKVYQFDKNTLELINVWPSIVNAERSLGISRNGIIGCCRGKYHTSGGYIWSYNDSVKSGNKRVYQFNMDGKILNSFYSYTDASNATGINKNNIRAAALGIYYSSGGYRWSIRENLIERLKKTPNRKIYMFSKIGEFLKQYDSVKEASLELGVSPTSIIEAASANNRLRTCCGYVWSYTKDIPTEKINPSKLKRVSKYSLSGTFIKEYPSIVSASKDNYIDKSLITKCCKGKIKSSGNYIWKYSENK